VQISEQQGEGDQCMKSNSSVKNNNEWEKPNLLFDFRLLPTTTKKLFLPEGDPSIRPNLMSEKV